MDYRGLPRFDGFEDSGRLWTILTRPAVFREFDLKCVFCKKSKTEILDQRKSWRFSETVYGL